MSRRILIVNDDGIEADGILRLAKAATRFGEVWVVAPESQRSAASHSITLNTYIDVYERDFPVPGVKAFAISGQPADCVRVGVLNVLPEKPDVVFSGINYGYNAGTDVQYSATVGAAMEAVFQGIPAIAFSEGTQGGKEITDRYLEEIIEEVIDTPYEWGRIVNVNFPEVSMENFQGIQRNVENSRGFMYKDSYTCEELTDGGRRYRVKGDLQDNAAENTDLRALFDGYIAIGYVYNIH